MGLVVRQLAARQISLAPGFSQVVTDWSALKCGANEKLYLTARLWDCENAI